MAMSYPRILKGTSILLVSALIGTASVGTASILTVTNTNDSGVGSLRNAILTASAGDTIDFNISGTGPFSIALLDPVAINEPLFINGASQPGYGGTPLIDVGLTTSGTPFERFPTGRSACTVRSPKRCSDREHIEPSATRTTSIRGPSWCRVTGLSRQVGWAATAGATK